MATGAIQLLYYYLADVNSQSTTKTLLTEKMLFHYRYTVHDFSEFANLKQFEMGRDRKRGEVITGL
jgi:hypothetical protein